MGLALRKADDRKPDMAVIKRLYYTIDKLKQTVDEYERMALPDVRVMSLVSISKALLIDVEKQLQRKL